MERKQIKEGFLPTATHFFLYCVNVRDLFNGMQNKVKCVAIFI